MDRILWYIGIKEGGKMKKIIKKLSLTSVIILLLIGSFGCNGASEPDSKVEVYTNIGFLDDMLMENQKNYVEIGINGGSLKLEVEDKNTFDNLEKGGFYKFAFNEDNILLSIEKDNYIESLVKNSMEEGITPNREVYISPTDKISTEALALLDSYEYDITGDGVEEVISMYVNAEQGSDGEIYWDDGQDWLFLVQGQEEDYILFNDYVQIGTINFHIYELDDDLYITTIQSGTANLDITEYKFDRDSKEFISTLKYGTQGNVNMLHSSYGY